MKNIKNDKIKIMYVTFSLDHGGAEKMIYDLSNGLNPDLFKPMICSFQDGGSLREDFETSGIQIFNVVQSSGKDITLPVRLYKLFKEQKPNIIHSHNGYMWLYSTIPARLTGARIVYTEHSVWENPTKLYLLGSKICELYTDSIVAPSNYVKELMSKKQSVKKENINVIYNGVDNGLFSRNIDIQNKKRELGFSSEEKIIGIVARLTPVKNHAALLHAMKIICSRIEKCRLLIIGDGVTRESLQNLVRELGLERAVLFLGTRNDVSELLRILDVFVLCSISEGFPISVLEAMSSGVPIAASSVGGIPEALADGLAGKMIHGHEPESIAEAIIELLLNPSEAVQLRTFALDYVQNKFSVDKMVQEYSDIYLNIR